MHQPSFAEEHELKLGCASVSVHIFDMSSAKALREGLRLPSLSSGTSPEQDGTTKMQLNTCSNAFRLLKLPLKKGWLQEVGEPRVERSPATLRVAEALPITRGTTSNRHSLDPPLPQKLLTELVEALPLSVNLQLLPVTPFLRILQALMD